MANILSHERLAIVDPLNGSQPLYSFPGKEVALGVNGEIWNHNDLRRGLEDYEFTTASDCEPIIPMYMRYGDEFIHKIDGIFAFVLSNRVTGQFFAARDPIGVMPCYVGWKNSNGDTSLWFSSELKALSGIVDKFIEFPPGHYMSSEVGTTENDFVRWFNPIWVDEAYIPSNPLKLDLLRSTLEASVVKRLMTDVPYGVLLSGGLDSSLVASIVSRHAKKERRRDSIQHGIDWWPRVHTFSIGMKGSPDLAAAASVAEFLGTVHHEFHFTLEEGCDALSQVIFHIETYDVTTVRASTPMFLLARRIKAMGVKMVLSGEGADEVFGGYLYFHKAPSGEEFHKETVRKISLLSKYDCLRANKSTAAWGVEAREPFLDRDFLNIAMTINPKEKMITKERPLEKWILRKAFDRPEGCDPKVWEPYLPDSVLWRQKEQFSDGVGYGWIDGLRSLAEKEVSDAEFAAAAFLFPYNTPVTKEAYLYRKLFAQHFPDEWSAKTVLGGPSIACSTPAAIEWEESWKKAADPSGRAVAGVHQAAEPLGKSSTVSNIHQNGHNGYQGEDVK